MDLAIKIDGELVPFQRVPFGEEHSASYLTDPVLPDHTCHDCGVAPGEEHAENCDWEACPRCGGQLISCDCDVWVRE